MATKAMCIITQSDEGKGAYGVRCDTDESVYPPCESGALFQPYFFDAAPGPTARLDFTARPRRTPAMCNLYRTTKGVDEVARLFSAVVGQVGNAGGDVYPGIVVAAGELRSMTWGFPLALKGQPLKPKPVNNTRADKLDSFMWRRRMALPYTRDPVRRSGG